MIGLRVAAGWLVLAPGTISMEISSPFFSTESVPGTTSYQFGLPLAGNQALLNFPHVRAEQGERIAPEPVEFYIDGQLRWVGALVYLEYNEAQELYAYNFVADAADFQSRIDGVSLPSLDLGRVPLTLEPAAADYALPCLRNSAFYGDKRPDYCGVVNYYSGGIYAAPPFRFSPTVPFLRFVPLLRRVMAALGYALTGPWLEEPEAQALVIYSDRAVENADGSLPGDFAVNRHVPDIGVAELLVAAQKLFGLGFRFHPVRREMSVQALRDVLQVPAYVKRTGGLGRTTALTHSGYLLQMTLESNDELNKTLPTAWSEFRVEPAQTTITTVAGTLHVVREQDPLATSNREWVLPAVEAKGASAAFELGDDSRCGLRLLLDRGLRPDSVRDLYPLATWDNFDALDNICGTSTLHWEGEQGLYATWHQTWLGFLDRATTREATMSFRVTDLLTLDPTVKELVGHRKYLWEKVSLSLKTTGSELDSATYTYRYTRV